MRSPIGRSLILATLFLPLVAAGVPLVRSAVYRAAAEIELERLNDEFDASASLDQDPIRPDSLADTEAFLRAVHDIHAVHSSELATQLASDN